MYLGRICDRIFENRIILENLGFMIVVGDLWDFISNYIRETYCFIFNFREK